jgi:hypothetical protein
MEFESRLFIFNRKNYSLHTSDILLNWAIKGGLLDGIRRKRLKPKTQEEFSEIEKKMFNSVKQMIDDLLNHAESIGRGEYPPPMEDLGNGIKLYRSNRISTLLQLKEAADQRKAVVVPKSHPWSKPKPAIVLLHQPGITLLRLFDLGMYVYQKKEIKNGRL